MPIAPWSVLAHQGGWDEALMIAGPILIVGWLLWLAKRRVRRAAEAQAVASENPTSETPTAETATAETATSETGTAWPSGPSTPPG